VRRELALEGEHRVERSMRAQDARPRGGALTSTTASRTSTPCTVIDSIRPIGCSPRIASSKRSAETRKVMLAARTPLARQHAAFRRVPLRTPRDPANALDRRLDRVDLDVRFAGPDQHGVGGLCSRYGRFAFRPGQRGSAGGNAERRFRLDRVEVISRGVQCEILAACAEGRRGEQRNGTAHESSPGESGSSSREDGFMQLQVRRMLLSIFAVTTALISSITFLALRNYWLLIGGLGIALVMFIIVLFLPTHLLENPLRHARGLKAEG
jgi:hypothetical protein